MIKPLSLSFLVALPFLAAPSQARADSWLEEIDARIFAPSPQQRNFNEGVELYRGGKVDEALAKFQMAALGEDRRLRAQALHNTAVIQIAKGELAPARDILKEASAFDNESQEIKENLAWVEERLNEKEAKEKPRENEAKDPESSEEKSAESQTAEQDPSASEQEARSKPGEESSKEDAAKAKEEATAKAESEEEKDAEGKEGKSAEAKQKDKQGQEKAGNAAEEELAQTEEKSATEKEPKGGVGEKGEKAEQKAASLDAEGAVDPGKGTEGEKILTPAEIKQQEAERLLRNIDDKIGRYPLTDTEATDRRGNDGKNW